jgi:hypothetical protein
MIGAGYFPPALARPGEVCITPWSYQSLGVQFRNTATTGPSGQNYITASLVIYVPFWIPEAVTFTKMFVVNGSAVTGAYDVGIYATDGTRLVSSGSISAAGTSQLQPVDITDTTCARGTYYMAIVSDTSAIGQKIVAATPVAGILQSLGMLQQASVTIPLSTNASPATFAKYASAFVPLFGVQGYRTIGP